MSLLPMVLIFAIFYFFLIRPQVRKQKEVEKMILELKKGDKVIAAGGIHAIVHKIEDDIITLEIAENTKIKVSKSSITEVVSKDKKISNEKPLQLEEVKVEAKGQKSKKTKKAE